jgi:hypothetical protein
MIHHEKKLCEFRDVPCDYCNEQVVFNKLAEHKEICENRPMSCEHCDLKFKPGMMVHHLERTCEGVMRPCPDGCDMMLPFPMFPSHATECMERRVPCSWAEYGCNELVRRKDLAAHDANMEYHIKKAVSQVRSMTNPVFTSLREMPWPPTLDMLRSLTGDYFVPMHLHAVKVTPHLCTVHEHRGLLKNTCNVKGPGCTGYIERIPGLPMHDGSGNHYFFGARCEGCDFDVCMNCFIANQSLPSRSQLKAVESTFIAITKMFNDHSEMSRRLVTTDENVRIIIRENTELRSTIQRYAAQIEQYDMMRQRLSRAEAALQQCINIAEVERIVEQRLQRFQNAENPD